MGKGKKKNGKPFIWKNPAFVAPVSAAVIGGIFLLINTFISSFSKEDSPPPGIYQETEGGKSPDIVAPCGSVTVPYTEASPELLDRLERANIGKGKQAQIIEELKKKPKETEEALKERHVSEDALARFKAGEYREAEALFAKELKEGAEKAASAAYYLGNISFVQIRFDDARKYYQKATELEPENPLYLNDLGFAYYTLGKYEKAIKHLEQALSIDKESYGGRYPDVARDLNNLGLAWDSLGEYAKAIEFYEQALSIDREFYGERHPKVAIIRLNNLGKAWYALGNYEKAIEFYEQALSIGEEFYREIHPAIATDLNNLGLAWCNLGNYEKARGCLKTSYKICMETLGENHPNTLQVKRNLDSLPR